MVKFVKKSIPWLLPILGHWRVNTSRTSLKITRSSPRAFLYHGFISFISYQTFLSLARLFWQNTPVKSCAAANWAAWLSGILLCMLVPKSLIFVTLRQPPLIRQMIWFPHLIFFVDKVVGNIFGPDVEPMRTLLNWDGQLWIRVVSGCMRFWGHHGQTWCGDGNDGYLFHFEVTKNVIAYMYVM